jgi:signal transduction histidine kinase
LVAGGDAALPGFTATGPYAGTIGVLVAASSTSDATPIDVPDPLGYATAQGGTTTVRETTYLGSPVRVLSVPVPRPGSGAAGAPLDVVQIIGDRSSEMRTLTTLLWVLVGGGLVALVAATLVGSLYATRALVPIRASLQRQREFAADTSHELRTPLAVIRAGLARVRQQPEARVAEVGPALDALDAEAIRLTSLVDDLLALARTDAGSADLDLMETDLAEIAADALAALHPLAGTREVRLELDVEPAQLRADPIRLRRLVTVLVDNGIRHGRAGGLVRVTVRAGRLTVDDDGPGIAAADRPHVFDRFWRGAQAAPGGSGLGLAIAAWIAERHGGRIDVDVSPLGGARFDVFLPVR